MGQASTERMLLPRLLVGTGHLHPWVKQTPAAGTREGRIVGGQAGWRRGTHSRPPGSAACGCPCFSRELGARAASAGQAASLSRLLLTRCLFFSSLFRSLQLPAQAIQEEPQEPVETQRQSRAQTHPLEWGQRDPGGKREREIFNRTVILTESISSSSSCCFFCHIRKKKIILKTNPPLCIYIKKKINVFPSTKAK